MHEFFSEEAGLKSCQNRSHRFFIGPQVIDRLNYGQFQKWHYCEVVNNRKWTFLKQVRHEGNALGLEGGLGSLAGPPLTLQSCSCDATLLLPRNALMPITYTIPSSLKLFMSNIQS